MTNMVPLPSTEWAARVAAAAAASNLPVEEKQNVFFSAVVLVSARSQTPDPAQAVFVDMAVRHLQIIAALPEVVAAMAVAEAGESAARRKSVERASA